MTVLAKDFQALVHERHDAVKAAEKERITLQKKVYDAERKEHEEARKLSRLNRIAYIAGWKHRNGMEWTKVLDKEESVEIYRYQEVAWKMGWEMDTSIYNFRIYLSERTDLKRDKWEVSIIPWHTTLSEQPSHVNGGYRDTDYGKNKYGEDALTKKFRSEKAAMAYVEDWMKRLYEDHKEHIDEERKLMELCKKSGFKYEESRRFW